MSRTKNQLSQNVLRIIRELGGRMIVRRVENGSYNSTTGVQERITSDYNATVVIVQFKKDEADRDPSILRDDRKAYILPLDGYSPKPGDILSGVGDDSVLISVRDVLRLGEASMVHVCQVRG